MMMRKAMMNIMILTMMKYICYDYDYRQETRDGDDDGAF